MKKRLALLLSTTLAAGILTAGAITASAEDDDEVYQTAKNGMQGWVDCFEKAKLVKVLSGGGLNDPADAEANESYLKAAYELGKNI